VIAAGIISGYFVVGAILEERKLVKHFGDAYRTYQQRVPMLFPVKWLVAFFQIVKKTR
jgi:protein-S-isoprenylcysteine O-methyltransferase Ste14